MDTVRQILDSKPSGIWSVSTGTSTYEALRVLAGKDIGALLVLDEEEVVGIFSERDFARKVGLEGKSPEGTPVSDVMTRQVLCISPEKSLEDCMALMTAKHIRHLPVMKDDRLIGIVTIGDVVKKLISHQKSTINQLSEYITRG